MAPKIAIVGAGPAGCMLARLLHLGGLEAIVYEAEASPNYRAQGGSLDLHTGTGLAALRDAGLFAAFEKHARYDGEYLMISDEQAQPLFVKGEKPTNEHTFGGQRPEIDRAVLRQLLTESLPAGTIQWNHKVKSVASSSSSAGAVITFADGTTADGFDLVVGADGAWSKVRAALSDQQPVFSGLGMHELHIPDADNTAPALAALAHRGSIFAYGEGRMLAVQQMGDGSLHIGATVRRDRGGAAAAAAAGTDDANRGADDGHDWMDTCGYDVHDLAAVQQALLTRPGMFRDYAGCLQAAITHAAGATTPRSLYMLPVGFTWTHRRGLTIIGDAAHLMTPYAGEGVNVALDDARKLAATILAAAAATATKGPPSHASSHDALDAAVAAFEKEMWTRTVRVTKLTEDLMKAWFFTPGAPHTVIASTIAMHARFRMPALVQPLMTALVHAYYFVHKRSLKKAPKAEGDGAATDGADTAEAKKTAVA
ncbi:tetracycline resistance protein from transposon [Niveomyces insectorum RCEF 264]|uniref:Tetracycline resistance protein from transposon n=1 Tax=Niveomyces insectorum RCEF 264 TaxID=1081102 RepID=A0A167QHJ4_9HYPO|nr:tetracycline resistance protein from transposon [Niveomyces insectorum RCEF 264]